MICYHPDERICQQKSHPTKTKGPVKNHSGSLFRKNADISHKKDSWFQIQADTGLKSKPVKLENCSVKINGLSPDHCQQLVVHTT
jgi:hypothetical protein